MGSCLSLNCASCDMFSCNHFYEKKGYESNMRTDMDGITFSHYSLTSETSFLDLYPTLKFMENDQSSNSVMTNGSCCADYDHWRHSGLPLIDDDNVEESCCQQNSNRTISANYHCKSNQSVPELKISEANGPNTSSLMIADSDISGVTVGVTNKMNNVRSKAMILDASCESNYSNDAMKDKFACDLLEPSSIEDQIDERIQLHPTSTFGYSSLDDEGNTKRSRSPFSSRFHFNNRVRMRRSLTPNQNVTENHPRLSVFRRRNTVQDQISQDKS